MTVQSEACSGGAATQNSREIICVADGICANQTNTSKMLSLMESNTRGTLNCHNWASTRWAVTLRL
jgi:hypothetical protein